MKDGGSQRRAAAETLIQSLGGTIECMYFAFGAVDVLAIVDLPDHAASSGAMTGRMTVLLTPEEIDDAVGRGVAYTPPGQ